MKRSMAVAVALLAALAVAAPANAGPLYTGDTSIPGSQPAGATLMVDVVVFSEGPVVPYEIAIQNECQLPNRGARTVQRDDIVEWVDTAGSVPAHGDAGVPAVDPRGLEVQGVPDAREHAAQGFGQLVHGGRRRALTSGRAGFDQGRPAPLAGGSAGVERVFCLTETG